jgi:6-phosphogluconolactonase
VRVIVEPDAAAVASTAAELVREELSIPGPATLGLAGGRTPAATYRLLAGGNIDWERIGLWLSDERWVPADHPDSNALMARQTLGPDAVNRLLVPAFDLGQPNKAAAAYGRELENTFAATGGVPGTVLLGIGADGHTASLFPGTAALTVEDRLYVANHVSRLGAWRLSATVPLLASARHLVFLATGGDKAEVVAEVLDKAVPYPARLVAERAAEVTWILDANAASGLAGVSRR